MQSPLSVPVCRNLPSQRVVSCWKGWEGAGCLATGLSGAVRGECCWFPSRSCYLSLRHCRARSPQHPSPALKPKIPNTADLGGDTWSTTRSLQLCSSTAVIASLPSLPEGRC